MEKILNVVAGDKVKLTSHVLIRNRRWDYSKRDYLTTTHQIPNGTILTIVNIKSTFCGTKIRVRVLNNQLLRDKVYKDYTNTSIPSSGSYLIDYNDNSAFTFELFSKEYEKLKNDARKEYLLNNGFINKVNEFLKENNIMMNKSDVDFIKTYIKTNKL